MMPAVRLLTVVALLLADGAWSAATAQADRAPAEKIPTAMLVAVLRSRGVMIERTTPIDGCSMYQAMETPADFFDAFRDRLLIPLNRRDRNPCATPTPPRDTVIDGRHGEVNRGCVRFESVRRDDSSATVRLRVVKNGDASFREEYRLRRRDHDRDRSWVVIETSLSGLVYFQYVRNPGC